MPLNTGRYTPSVNASGVSVEKAACPGNGDEGGVQLELAVDLQVGAAFAGQGGGVDDLLDGGAVGRALGGEAEHGHARLDLEQGAAGLSRLDGRIGQLLDGAGAESHLMEKSLVCTADGPIPTPRDFSLD